MGNILFLSFAEHKDVQSKSKKDFFYLSLEEQYEKLLNRLPANRRIDNLESFIEICFTSNLAKKYYISCPNFIRERKKSDNEGAPTYLNNVVLRPELTLNMRSCLPDNQNVILIGDIKEGNNLKCMVIKGIEFIDASMNSPHDLVLGNCVCCNCFYTNTRYDGRKMPEWSIRGAQYSDSYFTPDNVNRIIQECYTVSNPILARIYYDSWQQYMDFRKYYLDEQSNRNFKLDNVDYLDSFAINRKDYRKDTVTYDDYILDGLDDFKKSDMIMLNRQIGDAISFPLIRVNIERNKKEFLLKSIKKGNKLVNDEERKIRSLASDNVFLSVINPTSKETYEIALKNGYELGDRFKVIKYDILPQKHIKEIENELSLDISKSNKSIDTKYAGIIDKEVNKLANEYVESLEKEAQKQISEQKIKQDNRLEEDIRKNQDISIIKRINSLENEIKKKIKKDKKESSKDFENRLKEELSKINIRQFYIDRNYNIIADLILKYENDIKQKKSNFIIREKEELTNKYHNDVIKEKAEAENNLTNKANQDIEKAKEDETILRFSIYFKLKEGATEPSQKQQKDITECEYIVYDKRAEEAKIYRQERALNNFYEGNVKNPYLSTYLFAPKELQQISYDNREWNWYLDTLNEKQKEAVKKAISSNGIFLLQGPPGTGKTQVIAETVAHLVKQGKKVLISSETHKAIDNVFERLPKIAEIVPIRLIPSQSRKDSEYSPENLVDNFYCNISTNMIKTIKKYNNFRKNREDFDDTFKKLKLLYSKIEKGQKAYLAIKEQMDDIEKSSSKINLQISDWQSEIDDIKIEIDILKRTIRNIERNRLKIDDDIKVDIITSYIERLKGLIDFSIFKEVELEEIVSILMSLTEDKIEKEIVFINPNTQRTVIEMEQDKIRKDMDKCRDELGDTLPGKEEELNKLRGQFIANKNKLVNLDVDVDDSSVLKRIFNLQYLVDNSYAINELVSNLQNKIHKIQDENIDIIEDEIEVLNKKIEKYNIDINVCKDKNKVYQDELLDLQEDDTVVEIKEQSKELEISIDNFFKDFNIELPYNSIKEALEIIEDTWDDLEKNFEIREKENKGKIPMYDKISRYLSSEDVIKDDRKIYTKDLFENANVFGITCTSNDRFRQANNKQLEEYNLDDIDIKTVGIDVVIIDEVSKSSFLDLLIPILYGKTIILVGDHRQLPPMYDLSKLREEDYEGLDENIINPEINKSFTRLYETCFFKKLFEDIGSDYKTMLQQQYRCHSDIMDVFNHFYQNDLRIGFAGQNNMKKHHISIYSNNIQIIEPNKHIYFVNCKKTETRDKDSTSIYNVNEANVVVELIKKINTFFKKHSEYDKLSMGVICTYGDQAKKIKDRIKQEKVKTDAIKTDEEKWIVSTVDDFQGDERDIIILSTVRNPEKPGQSNPGFITAYQRINVALSRARRLLIIVGNRQYLESRGVIDLPDVYGRGKGYDKKDFHVYERILDTIERKGKVIEDIDVFEDKEDRLDG